MIPPSEASFSRMSRPCTCIRVVQLINQTNSEASRQITDKYDRCKKVNFFVFIVKNYNCRIMPEDTLFSHGMNENLLNKTEIPSVYGLNTRKWVTVNIPVWLGTPSNLGSV